MKKGKVIGKKHIVVGVMAVALAVAVALNMKYAGSAFDTDKKDGDNLGDSIYVDAKVTVDAFGELRDNRDKVRKEALELLNDTISGVKSDAAAIKEAEKAKNAIALRMEQESTIESLLKAKGFKDVLVVLGESDANVAVKCDSLLDSETLQIQDAVISQSGLSLEKVKIVTVK